MAGLCRQHGQCVLHQLGHAASATHSLRASVRVRAEPNIAFHAEFRTHASTTSLAHCTGPDLQKFLSTSRACKMLLHGKSSISTTAG